METEHIFYIVCGHSFVKGRSITMYYLKKKKMNRRNVRFEGWVETFFS